MTHRLLALALLASTALLPSLAFAGSDYGSMPIEGMGAYNAAATTPATTSTQAVATTTTANNNMGSTYNNMGTSSGAATSGTAASGLYIEGRAGYNSPRVEDTDSSATYGGAIGYRFSPNFRAETDLSYRENDYSLSGVTGSGSEKHLSAMLNGYYDFANNSRFTPYVGAGVGFDRATIEANYTASGSTIKADDSDIAFAYNLMAGIGYAVTKNIDLTLGYRWLDTSTATVDAKINTTSTTLDGEYKAHEVLAGVRYNF